MWYLIAAAVALAYVVIAVIVARFCGVNSRWEKALDSMDDEDLFTIRTRKSSRETQTPAEGSA